MTYATLSISSTKKEFSKTKKPRGSFPETRPQRVEGDVRFALGGSVSSFSTETRPALGAS